MDEPRDVQGQEEKIDGSTAGRDAQFERELKHAFVRVNAPESLAKFLAIAAEAETARQASGRKLLWFRPRINGRESHHSVLAMPRMQNWFGGAIAAALVIGCFGAVSGIHIRNEHRQAAAEREFAQSEQITDRALEHARQQMQKAGVSLDGQE